MRPPPVTWQYAEIPAGALSGCHYALSRAEPTRLPEGQYTAVGPWEFVSETGYHIGSYLLFKRPMVRNDLLGKILWPYGPVPMTL